MTNIHDAANFKPEEYYVLDYLDNRRPAYMGQPVACWQEEIKHWEAEMSHYFPGWRSGAPSIHKCGHCGNCTVRYIVAVEHQPTKTNVVFGSECVAKLNFANRSELKAAQVQARAEQGNARMAVYQRRCNFLATDENLAALVASIDEPIHAKNSFAHDIVRKLNQYGSLSARQVECLIASMQRDLTWAATRAARAQAEELRKATAQPAPTGRVKVQGVVLSIRFYESQWGGNHKMLVQLDTGARVFVSVPSDLDTECKGQRVEFTATFTPAPDDALFAFGKRPTKARVLTTESAVVS